MTGDGAAYCGRCGNPVQEGDRFCGVCGAPVLPPPPQAEQVIPTEEVAASHAAGAAPRGRVLVWVLGLGVLAVLLVGGGAIAALAFGDRLGLAGDPNAPSAPENRSEGGGASPPPEATAAPEGSTASTPPEETVALSDPAPDAAFERILPTLDGMTSVPIMLPTELPSTVQDVAIDGDATDTEGYGVLFLNESSESTEVVQQYVNAYVDGTLEASLITGGGPQFPEPGAGYEEVASGEVQTPDGIDTLYRCYDTQEGVSGPHCTGGYLLPDPGTQTSHLYVLTLEGAEAPPEQEIRQVLSSMVPVMAQTTEAPGESPEAADAQDFVTEYYAEVAEQDWAGTYALLDAASQAEFTEEEWEEVQELRVAQTDPPRWRRPR